MADRWLRSFQSYSALLLSISLLGAFDCTESTAQTPANPSASSATTGLPVTASSGRRLAADAINIIPPGGELGDTFVGPVELPLLSNSAELNWTPNLAPADETLANMVKAQVFRSEIWSFEFGFKPVRMIGVDLPDGQGGTKTKVVWYLLYYVKYLGGDLMAQPQKDEFGNEIYQPTPSGGRAARRFIPGLTLNSTSLDKRYEAKFIPQAVPLIVEKERVGKPVYDTVAIQKVPVEQSNALVSKEVWGVATWTDVDPRTNFFTVEVRGLTNAQRSENVAGKFESKQKTLVLYFSRPGDTINELDDIIRYGVPASTDPVQQKMIFSKYGVEERLDYQWIYR